MPSRGGIRIRVVRLRIIESTLNPSPYQWVRVVWIASWGVLGLSGRGSGAPWACFWASLGLPGLPWATLGFPRPSLGFLGVSWACLGVLQRRWASKGFPGALSTSAGLAIFVRRSNCEHLRNKLKAGSACK